MVRGLERFREHFSAFSDRYVLIGGTACDLALSDAGLAFRATRDLDVVLRVEALDREFAEAFWAFLKSGGYLQKEAATGERALYRFRKPADDSYPEMLELFSRVPDALAIPDKSHLIPIPIDGEIASFSAILLKEDYYRWIHEGKVEIQGVSIVRAEHLIPLKARAWIDLSERKAAGDRIDSKKIKKHRNDVFRLVQIVDPDYEAAVPEAIGDDMRRFIADVVVDPPDLDSLGIRTSSFEALLDVVKSLCQIG